MNLNIPRYRYFWALEPEINLDEVSELRNEWENQRKWNELISMLKI